MVNMNSLVKDLCNKCENNICENHRGCAFRSLSNEYCDEVERLDLYINQLNQENQQLKEQLKQRDEVIDEAIEFTNHYRYYLKIKDNDYLKDREHYGYLDGWQVDELLEILNKYKGNDNK